MFMKVGESDRITRALCAAIILANKYGTDAQKAMMDEAIRAVASSPIYPEEEYECGRRAAENKWADNKPKRDARYMDRNVIEMQRWGCD